MSCKESSQVRRRELCRLLDDYGTIARNQELEPERRYDLVMSEKYVGRIKALFKSLGVSPNIDYWGPQIIGYDTCIALVESEINSCLRGLKYLLPEK